MQSEKVAHSKEAEEIYAKSMFPEILGQKLVTINKRIEKHELPTPTVVIKGDKRDTGGWTREQIIDWWNSFPGKGVK